MNLSGAAYESSNTPNYKQLAIIAGVHIANKQVFTSSHLVLFCISDRSLSCLLRFVGNIVATERACASGPCQRDQTFIRPNTRPDIRVNYGQSLVAHSEV